MVRETPLHLVDHSVRRALVRAGIRAAAPPAWDGHLGGAREENGHM